MRHLGAVDAQVTSFRSDGGVDVVSLNHVAQVKHQLGAVGRPEIQQIAGIANVENKVAVFFTTNRYSSEARNFAEVAGVALFVMNPEEGTLRQVNEAAKSVFPFAVASA
jgi:restriction endonuclease Mrr